MPSWKRNDRANCENNQLMKIAIMQPYFFPYIGYFQLINAVDKFVLYDDVNFIKQGWINRNRILLNNKDFFLTLQLSGASSFKRINEIKIGNNKDNLLKTIEQAYKKSPYFDKVFSIFESVLKNPETNLAVFLEYSIKTINNYLDIPTEILISSQINKKNELKGQEKVIEICKKLNTDDYINSFGGMELYSKENFLDQNIHLKFLKTNEIKYNQFNNEFVPFLSIIDILMFNSKEEVKGFLNKYTLI